MSKHWRKDYLRKDGTFVPGQWVHGSNPAKGSKFWLLSVLGITAAATTYAGRRAGRKRN